MTPGTKTDRWKLIQDIFQAALDLPLSERADYVAQRACGADEDLWSEVSSLLANDRDDRKQVCESGRIASSANWTAAAWESSTWPSDRMTITFRS
jgi:hypothetical protein